MAAEDIHPDKYRKTCTSKGPAACNANGTRVLVALAALALLIVLVVPVPTAMRGGLLQVVLVPIALAENKVKERYSQATAIRSPI